MTNVRYAIRQLLRAPAFSCLAILTLALGIAASTAVFSVVNAVMFRPLRTAPLDGAYGLTLRHVTAPRQETITSAHRDALRLDPPPGLVAVAAAQLISVTAQSDRFAEHLLAEIVDGDFAAVFDMQVAAGRRTATDASAGGQVVISDRLWRRWYQADPVIAGSAHLLVNGQSLLVVGVAAPGFQDDEYSLWIPRAGWRPSGNQLISTDNFRSTYLRLSPSANPVAVAAGIANVLSRSSSPPPPGFTPRLTSLADGHRAMRSLVLPQGVLVIALSALVLLGACANLANMLYARGMHRAGEVAVRLALGAGARRIFMLFLTEMALIAAAASAAGLVLAAAVLRLIPASLPAPRADGLFRFAPEMSPDWYTVAYALGAGVSATTIVGGLTAWRASRMPPLGRLGASGVVSGATPRGRWMRTGLVSLQVSSAVILLLGTGLYIIRALEIFESRVTFDFSRLATARVNLSLHEYTESRGRVFFDRLLEELHTRPDIESAALATGLPGGAYSQPDSLRNLVAEDEAQPGQFSTWRLLTGQQAGVSSAFLDALGLPVVRGRKFTPNDRDGAPRVVMLSESATRSLWPGGDPIGKRVRLANDPHWWTVVGVFEDATSNRSDSAWTCGSCLALYPYDQRYHAEMIVVLRSTAPAAAAEAARSAIHALDGGVAVFDAAAAGDSILARLTPERALALVASSLGLVSLGIAILGVYGVISYSVMRRTREFGIRLALGATPRGILRAVLDDAVHLVLVGLVPGVLLASWSTRVLESRLVRMMPNDIPTWAAVPTLILVVGILAAYVPARRAARVDPNVALKEL